MGIFKQIDVSQARAMITAGSVVIVDIRDEASYHESHIEGARLLNDATIAEFLVNADRTKPVVCYCYHGFSSQSAAGFLAAQGFKDVYSVIGGFEEWRKEG
jgi:thiosulfate sulfurtransferase